MSDLIKMFCSVRGQWRWMALCFVLLAPVSSWAQITPTGTAATKTTTAADSSKLKFVNKIGHWITAYGMSGEEFVQDQRDSFKTAAFAEVYIECIIDYDTWLFNLLNRVTKLRNEEKQSPYIFFELTFKPKDETLNSYTVPTFTLKSSSTITGLDKIASDAHSKYLKGKTYTEPVQTIPDVEKAVKEVLNVLKEKLGNSLAPDLMVRYNNEFFWNGHEIDILDTEGNYVELEAINKNIQPYNPNDIVWTNADPSGSKGVVDMTGVSSKTVSLKRKSDSLAMTVTVKRASLTDDVNDILKAAIIEALTYKKQQAKDTLVTLRQDSTKNTQDLVAQLALLERGNFPMENVGGSLNPLFSSPQIVSVADSAASFGNDSKNNERKKGFEFLRKHKRLKSLIRKKINVVAFADLVVDHPEEIKILLEELLKNSGRLVAQLILNQNAEGKRDVARNIAIDFLNKNLERIAGGRYTEDQRIVTPLPVTTLAPRGFVKGEHLYISSSVDFDGRQEFINDIKEYLKSDTSLYVIINYSQDVSTDSYLVRANGWMPKGLPEGSKYVVVTLVNIPGSVKIQAVGNKAIRLNAFTTTNKLLKNYIKTNEVSAFFALAEEGLTDDPVIAAQLPPLSCASKLVLLPSNEVAEFDNETYASIKGQFTIVNNRLISFKVGEKLFTRVDLPIEKDGKYQSATPSYYFANWDGIKEEVKAGRVTSYESKDEAGKTHIIYLGVLNLDTRFVITLKPKECAKDVEVIGSDLKCYPLVITDCNQNGGNSMGDGNGSVVQFSRQPFSNTEIEKLLNGEKPYNDPLAGKLRTVKLRIFLTDEFTLAKDREYIKNYKPTLGENVTELYFDGTKWNLVGEPLAGQQLSKAYVDAKLPKLSFNDFLTVIQQLYKTNPLDNALIAVYSFFDASEKFINKAKVPEMVWNCNSTDTKDPYNPMYAKVFGYLINPLSTVFVNLQTKVFLKFTSADSKEAAFIKTIQGSFDIGNQVQFAFVCGLWDGIVDIPGAVAMILKTVTGAINTKGIDDFKGLYKKATGYERREVPEGEVVSSGFWGFMKDGLVTQFSPSTPCLLAHNIAPVVVAALVTYFTAGAGSQLLINSTAGRFVFQMLNILNKIDLITEKFSLGARLIGKVGSAALHVSVKLGGSTIKYIANGTTIVFKVVRRSGEIFEDLNWSTSRVGVLAGADGKFYNVMMDADPSGNFDLIGKRIKKIIADEKGNVLKDEKGNMMAELDDADATPVIVKEKIPGELSEALIAKLRNRLGDDFLQAVQKNATLKKAFDELGDKSDDFIEELAESPVLKQRTLANADYVRAFKEYDPNKVYQINNNNPRNSSPPLPKKIKSKNGIDVEFDTNGFPDLTDHVVTIGGKKQFYEIDMQGTYSSGDFAVADALAGIDAKYRLDNDLTWHHHQDGKTMILVPKDINGVPHTGGAAIIDHNKSKPILYFPPPAFK